MRTHKATLQFVFLLAVIIAARVGILISLHEWSLDRGRAGLSPLDMGGDDGDYYFRAALAYARGIPVDVSTVYPKVLGILFNTFGTTEVLLYKALNVLASLGVVAVSLRIFAQLSDSQHTEGSPPGGPQNRRRFILLLTQGFYPSAIAYSSLSLYRDAWISLSMLTSLLFFLRAVQAPKAPARLAHGILAACFLAALYALRWYACFAVLAGLSWWLTTNTIRASPRSRRTRWLLRICFVCVGMGIFLLQDMLFPSTSAHRDVLEYRTAATNSMGGSSLGIDYSALPTAVWPLAFLYSAMSNAFGPLPWQIHSLASLATALLEGIPFLALATLHIRRQNSRIASLLIDCALVWFVLIAISNDNVGTATRLRMPGWQLLLISYAASTRVFVRDHQSATPRFLKPAASSPASGHA